MAGQKQLFGAYFINLGAAAKYTALTCEKNSIWNEQK